MNDHDQQTIDTLLAAIAVPPATVADDVARGRRQLRRRRLSAAGAGLAVVAVVGGTALAVPGLSGDRTARWAGGDTSIAPGPEVTPTVAPQETEIPQAEESAPTTPRLDFPTLSDDQQEVRRANRALVASHLDPDGTHIAERDIEDVSGFSGSSDGDVVTALSEKISWRNPGEDGLGLVQLTIGTAFDFECGGHGPGGPSATCTPVRLGDVDAMLVEDGEGNGVTYAYQRPGDYAIQLTLNPLFGNNSVVPVSGIDVPEASIGALLADPALELPGSPEIVADTSLPGERMREIAAGVLDPDGRHLAAESWAGDTGGYYSASWLVDGVEVADLQVSDQRGNFDVDDPCSTSFATRCVRRTVDGLEVRIDYRRKATGSGYDVTVNGPRRTIWIYIDPADPRQGFGVPVDLAVQLATDPRFQAN